LWIVLAALMAVGAVNGQMPRWAPIAAFVLVPLSCAAALVAPELDPNYRNWSVLVPIALPPLIAFYAMWARVPAIHRSFPEPITSLCVWTVILVLTMAPLAVSYV